MTSHDQKTPREIAVEDYQKIKEQLNVIRDELRKKGERVIEVSCVFSVGEDVLLKPNRIGSKRRVPVRIQRRAVTDNDLKPIYRVQKKSRYGYTLMPSWYDEDELEAVK